MKAGFLAIALLIAIVISGHAETRKLRFFNLDLHISVIADVKQILESMGHEVVDWSISGHTWVFGKQPDQVYHIGIHTWADLDPALCDRFVQHYWHYLNTFDAFIVTHTPCFALLYEKLNKPILIVNSTRYEQPFYNSPKKLEWLNTCLINGAKNNKIFIVSNNKLDQKYIKYYTGIENEWIPSLCRYTRSHYTGKNKSFVFYTVTDALKAEVFSHFENKNLIHDQLATGYSWQELYDYKGIVTFPYQISTMSLFEQYSANVPLFLPSKFFLKSLRHSFPHICGAISYYRLYGVDPPPGDINHTDDPMNLDYFVDAADYYDPENMPHIQYYDSFEELEQILKTVDCQAISDKMKEYNIKRGEFVMKKWGEMMEKIASSL